MITIYKYPIQPSGRIEANAEVIKIVSVGLDPLGQQCIWALVDTRGYGSIDYQIYGTGHPINTDWHDRDNYVGTFNDGPFVWHLFAEITNATSDNYIN